jgi:hypothetical protein
MQTSWIALVISAAVHLLTLGYLVGVIRTQIRKLEKEVEGGNGTTGLRKNYHDLRDKVSEVVLVLPGLKESVRKLEERRR